MGDVMMFGIARMPYEMAMDDELSRLQFYQNTQRLVDALEAAREDADKVIFRIEQYANDQERDPIVVPSSRLRAWASDLRSAIDQTRGKGGGEVA